jgi:hypothetical protein
LTAKPPAPGLSDREKGIHYRLTVLPLVKTPRGQKFRGQHIELIVEKDGGAIIAPLSDVMRVAMGYYARDS